MRLLKLVRLRSRADNDDEDALPFMFFFSLSTVSLLSNEIGGGRRVNVTLLVADEEDEDEEDEVFNAASACLRASASTALAEPTTLNATRRPFLVYTNWDARSSSVSVLSFDAGARDALS